MNAIRNKVQLIGHLGHAPEIKTLEGGKKVANMSLATNESYRSAQGEKVTDTQWHTLVAWGKLADLAEKHLSKGAELAIEGRLINKNYVDKKGVKHTISEVQVNELLILGKKA